MLLKCYYHLHPLSKNVIVDQDGVNDNKHTELVKEVVNKEFFIFNKFQVNAKEFKCPFQLWETHESMFPI